MVDALDFRWPSREEITMKQHWGTDELVEHWTLLPRETELLTNKTGATRLGFAMLLKFFQLEAYFPQHASAVPTVAVEFIAKQVHMRDAIRRVVNTIFCVRHPHIWGEGTTACASDSKKFGAWDQNLMTEWHVRYGGRGVMIYWHVEHKSTCIYSQLKTCSSSEVAAMIEGVLRHCTEIIVNKQYVDSHGQSEVAFAFCHLLGFELLPRLKAIHAQKLYRVEAGQPEEYPNLEPVLTRAIDWILIRQQYDQMVKYADSASPGHCRDGIHPSPLHTQQFTASDVQSSRRTRQSDEGHFSLSLFAFAGVAARN
jgi:TnpA family transposase